MGAKIVMGGFLVSRLLCEKRVVSLFGFGSCPQEQPHLVWKVKPKSAIPVSSHLLRPRCKPVEEDVRPHRSDRFPFWGPAREILSRLLVFKLSQGILLLVIRRQRTKITWGTHPSEKLKAMVKIPILSASSIFDGFPFPQDLDFECPRGAKSVYSGARDDESGEGGRETRRGRREVEHLCFALRPPLRSAAPESGSG